MRDNPIPKMFAACKKVERTLKAKPRSQDKDDLFLDYFVGVLPAFADAVGIEKARSYAAAISRVRIETL